MKGHFTELFDAFFDAIWNTAWQASAYFELVHHTSRYRDLAKAQVNIYRAAVMIVLFVSFGGNLIRAGINRLAIKT